jgi:SecD/SecF fusion protein
MRSGVVACIAAGIFVAALMVGFYGLLGVAATLAMAINIVMVLAIMGILGMVLTLPGLAAIVLIIGISLDANVLIYERVREEEKKTHFLVDALKHGFARAVRTVIDANLTVLIVAIILFYVSKGAVRGFAATLIVGLITTFFTACLVARSIVDLWISRRKHIRRFPNPLHGDPSLHIHRIGDPVAGDAARDRDCRNAPRHRFHRRVHHRGSGKTRRGRCDRYRIAP